MAKSRAASSTNNSATAQCDITAFSFFASSDPTVVNVSNHPAEEYARVYERRFEHTYGRWRPHVAKTLDRFLACGDPHHGFARVHCDDCGHEYLLAFSCKAYCFCPSCHQKRALLFGEWLDAEVLGNVVHRQYVFTIPKVLRGLFRREPRLLGLLPQAAWRAIKVFFNDAFRSTLRVPGAVMAVQSYGDMVNPNAHVHALITEGAFDGDGHFAPLPFGTDIGLLTELFRQFLFRALRKARRINDTTIQRMLTWTYSGFNCHRGNHLEPGDSVGRQRVARYLLHPPLSLERMTYDPAEAVVTYRSDRQNRLERFDPLDWLARVASHIPDKGTQLVRYYGAYSNRVRGARKKAGAAEQPPVSVPLAEPKAPLATRQNWARLLAAVWQTDPLMCPRCGGFMRILAAIREPAVIRKILRHLGLWDVPARAPPRRPGDGDLFADSWETETRTHAAPEHDEQPVEVSGQDALGRSDDVPEVAWPPAQSDEEVHDPWADAWPEADPLWDE